MVLAAARRTAGGSRGAGYTRNLTSDRSAPFKLNDYRAVDIFVMPGLAALRTPAIQVDSVRVRFRVTGT